MNRISKATGAGGAFGIAILLVAAGSRAEQPKTAPPASARANAAPAAPAIEPEAAAAVERMGDYLKTLPAFSIRPAVPDAGSCTVLPIGGFTHSTIASMRGRGVKYWPAPDFTSDALRSSSPS